MNLLGSFKNTLSILLAILIVLGLSTENVRGSSSVTTIYIDPLLSFAVVDEHFNITIEIRDAIDVYAWQVNLTFDSTAVRVVNATLPPDHFLEGRPEGTSGLLKYIGERFVLLGCTIYGHYLGMHGSGTLATVEFEVIAIGESILEIDTSQPYRTYLIDSELRVTDPGPDLRTQDSYFTSNAIDLSTYYQLLDLYNQLLANYSSLLASYYSLNSSYYSLLDEYQDLLSKYEDLESDYTSLNATYTALLDEFTQLQTDHNSLQSEYDNLSDSYNSLETLYQSLNSTYNSLQADYDDLKSKHETSTGELGTSRNLNYVLITTMIVFVVSAAYLVGKRSKLKAT